MTCVYCAPKSRMTICSFMKSKPKRTHCLCQALLASEKCFHPDWIPLEETDMATPTWRFGSERLNKIRRWSALHPYGTLTLVVLAALVPFLARPFNIDE